MTVDFQNDYIAITFLSRLHYKISDELMTEKPIWWTLMHILHHLVEHFSYLLVYLFIRLLNNEYTVTIIICTLQT